MEMVELKWRYRGVKQNLNRARAYLGKKFFLKKFKKEKYQRKTYLKRETKDRYAEEQSE